MTIPDARAFWEQQTSSGHRSDDAQFYRRKGVEHASLMTAQERVAGCVDLGCGAGELLAHVMDHVTVNVGIDYAQSMLDQAKTNLSGRDIDLINVNIFDYLPGSIYPVWTTTGAINQYLDEAEMGKFLDIFMSNENSRSIFLFDCLDPIRYNLVPFGISYLPTRHRNSGKLRAVLRGAYRAAQRWLFSSRLALGLFNAPVKKLPGVMGYGYLPRFWLEAAAARGLHIDIVSSQLYEYRYHVALRKDRV